MSSRRQFIRGGAYLAGGQIVAQSLSFARSVIVARLLSKEDFGIAAIFLSVQAFLNLISDLNVGTLLIQHKNGDDECMQAVAHAFSAGRGIVCGFILLLCAGPISGMFAAPEAFSAFLALSFLPVMRGLMHLDPIRVQRELRFGPSTIVETSSQLIATCVAGPLALWIRDYHAILWILIIQNAAALLLSHRLSETRYRWRYSETHAATMLKFGWPLLLNGVLLFCIAEGDRVVLGAKSLFPAYSKRELATFAIALSVTTAPSLLVGKVISVLFLPSLAREQDDDTRFNSRFAYTMQGTALLGGMLFVGFLSIGARTVTTIYGEKYADVGPLLGWLAAAQSVRLLRVGINTAALAKGDSANALVGNIGRCTGVALAVFAATKGLSLRWIAIAAVVGEVVGLFAVIIRLFRKQSFPVSALLRVPALRIA
jgi:O-antigen/teichoic acid export membrane protein